MSPPNTPGVPGMKLPPAAREEKREERRPGFANNAPPESMPPPPDFRREPQEDNPPMERPRARQPSQRDIRAEAEQADDRPSVVEFERAVHARYGKASYSGPAWVLLLLLGLAMLGVIIYLLATRAQPVAANCATIDQQRATDSKVDALSTSFSALTEKVITDNQRMHNDFVQLELNVIRQNSTK